MDSQKMEKSGKPTRLAAIILNWNTVDLLRKFLPAVIASCDSSLTTVIVADNGSTDRSADFVEQNFGNQVTVWRFDSNLGFAGGYNKAVSMAEGFEYVALINSDLETAPGWDLTVVNYLQHNKNVAAVQPKILSYNDKDTFEYAGAAGGFIDRNGYPYCRGRIFDSCETDKGQYDSPRDIFWASGAALVIRRSVYLECGGLDTAFFAHMEEIDLCWRVHLAGYRIVCLPQAKVYHVGGGSLPAGNPRKTYLNFRNNLLMLHKNLPQKQGRGVLLRRRLLDTLAWLRFVATFDWKNASAVWKAHRDFARMRTAYTRFPDRNLLDQAPQKDVNILLEYYLKRKKRFSDIIPK